MNPVSSATVVNASNADPGTVQGSAAISVLKRAIDSQAQGAAQLIAALPQPAPVAAGSPGALLNVYA
ncbi:MAG: putative motility protein [Burkholderiales bacterium]|nr:putative motility protein [Burkholderiales bacterium]MDE1928476.1 putative motility protein [Burkholderiales bacterium]